MRQIIMTLCGYLFGPAAAEVRTTVCAFEVAGIVPADLHVARINILVAAAMSYNVMIAKAELIEALAGPVAELLRTIFDAPAVITFTGSLAVQHLFAKRLLELSVVQRTGIGCDLI